MTTEFGKCEVLMNRCLRVIHSTVTKNDKLLQSSANLIYLGQNHVQLIPIFIAKNIGIKEDKHYTR